MTKRVVERRREGTLAELTDRVSVALWEAGARTSVVQTGVIAFSTNPVTTLSTRPVAGVSSGSVCVEIPGSGYRDHTESLVVHTEVVIWPIALQVPTAITALSQIVIWQGRLPLIPATLGAALLSVLLVWALSRIAAWRVSELAVEELEAPGSRS